PFVFLQTASTAPIEGPLASAGVTSTNVDSVKANGATARIMTRLQDVVRDRVVIIFSSGMPVLRRVSSQPRSSISARSRGRRLGVMRTAAWRIAHCASRPLGQFSRSPGFETEAEVPDPPRLWRFSTEMLPQRDRFSAFREGLARQVLTMDVVDHSGGRPR